MTQSEIARMIKLAESRLGQSYVLGAKVPKSNPNWQGPWDCAEFASWLLVQSTGKLAGVRNGDAYTGYWAEDAEKGRVRKVALSVAKGTPGCFLLRVPRKGTPGHIALVVGADQTIEAHSRRLGVCRAKIKGRRWDMGVMG